MMRPEAEQYVGSYVKAIHDFQSNYPTEISLTVGDVLHVTQVVDKNWLQGKNKDKSGNFPYDFVKKLQLPVTEGEQKVFASTENFPAQQDGDLEFRRGDVILGLYPIDTSWWQGQCGSCTGIFPLTHVMELEVPILLKQRARSVHASEPLFAQALVDSIAQLDEELSFQTGDIITVTEVVDEDWYEGECHGKSGMFLASCVSLLNEAECSTESTERKNHSFVKPNKKSNSLKRGYGFDTVTDNNVTPVSVTAQGYSNNVQQTTAESSHDEVIHQNNSHNISTESEERNRAMSYTSENTKAHNTDTDAGVTPYARTLYSFVGEMPDELSFAENDIVTLIQHIDEQWIEGEIDGKIGVFPVNYVEIVVDCPYAYLTDVDTNLQADSTEISHVNNTANEIKETSSSNHDQIVDSSVNSSAETVTRIFDKTSRIPEIIEENKLTDEQFALVLHTYKAEASQDLDIHEGETVTVIRKVDENWIEVKNDSGETGICPCGYVEIIGAVPDFTTQAHDSNKNEINKAFLESENVSSDNANTLKELNSKAKSNEHDKVELRKPSSDNMASAIIKDSKSQRDNIRNSASSDSRQIKRGLSPKPQVKPKPTLAPKPALKPKPSLSSKPYTPSSGYKPVAFNHSANIPKSSSTRSLSVAEDQPHSDSLSQTGSITKAQSMYEIHKTESEVITPTTSLTDLKGSHSGSASSLTVESENRNSTGSKKAFENWDLTKPLDSLLQSEFNKAKEEAETKSRSNSTYSSGSLTSSGKSNQDPECVDNSSLAAAARAASSFRANYSRSNYESMSEINVGNSTFFVSDMPDTSKRTAHLRKPPPPPSQSKENGLFNRRPSLKKAAPPRPVGPRVAPLPSKTPIVPTRTVPSKLPPGRPATTTTQNATNRPAGTTRKHGRPAPPRPQGTKRKQETEKSKGDNLMSFSPTNTSLEITEDEDCELVQELRRKIAGIEKDLQDFQKSKRELEQFQENTDEDDSGEIHDNIQFYDDNIHGITQELHTLREDLAKLCPVEHDKIAQEKALAKHKMEEAKMREEMEKKKEEEKKEREIKRKKVIEELMQTERDFIRSLQLMMEIFLGPNTEKHPEVDMDHLFGNIEEVADVSQRLLTKLEAATQGKDFTQQIIGTCFIVLAEDMKNVYAPYCRNHDDVITLIEKYNQNPDCKAFLDKLLDELREQHVVFDLEALLIKPVQRILKYPLLLNALIKATEEDHPDKVEILMALDDMTNVATAINEYKRRKDLVYKYKKDNDASLGDKLSKLSLHSIKKKSSRIRERFSANLGFIDQTRDTAFDKEEARYRHLDKTVKVFVKDVQLYLEQVQDVVSAQEVLAADIEDFYGEKRDTPEVQTYQAFCNKIHMTFLPNFQMEIDDLVTFPLNQMTQMFEAPNKVIQKRYDKLLDYDNMKRKAQNDKITDKVLQITKQDYEALNAQLLDELPRLYTLAFQLFRDCVGSFVRAQRDFTDHVLQDMYTMLDLQILKEEGVMEAFNVCHTTMVDRLAMLSFMPRTFSPRVADQKQEKKNKRLSLDPSMLRSTEAVPQLDSQKIFVTQQHAPSKLFRVTETHVAMDAMDISVCGGDIVGVIIEKDPMGNKERWFVDNGASKGFIPKKLLTAYEASPPRVPAGSSDLLQLSPSGSSQYSGQNLQSSGSHLSITNSAILHSLQEEEDEMDFALTEDMTPTVGQGHNMTPTIGQGHGTSRDNPSFCVGEEELELYYAEYGFTARTDNEVTMFEHQVVTVQCKHDQEGNPEWWYVDADGQHGYAPAAYLRKMETHGDPT